MKNNKEKYLLIICIIIQSIIYIIVGANKQYLHIDEAYSYGLANYDKVEIAENEDFFNNWHSKEYYEDYLAVQEKDRGNYVPVYENQKNDVHPPIYYLLLRVFMDFSNGHYTKWTGIALNVVLYAFITIFMYFILKKLLQNEKSSELKAIALAFTSSITLASLSNAIYIRMYTLLTLEILIITFLHIKLLECEKLDFKLLAGIGVSVLIGILTHYYFLFYLLALYLVFLVKYTKEKKLKNLACYTTTMLISGIISLMIFPYSVWHMFYGERGQGVITNLTNIPEMLKSIFATVHNLNYYGFNNLLIPIMVMIIGISVYSFIAKKNQVKISNSKKELLKIIYIPTIFFFIIAAIASPWKVLRYIVPVCGVLFVLTIYWLYEVMQRILNEKITNIVLGIILCAILVIPIACKMEPELLYSDRKEMMQMLTEKEEVPTIYLFNSQKASFLDDILLFATMRESYVAKDIEYTEENIQEIIKTKDMSQGVFVLMNEENSDEILQIVKEVTDLENSEMIKKLTSTLVYYVN